MQMATTKESTGEKYTEAACDARPGLVEDNTTDIQNAKLCMAKRYKAMATVTADHYVSKILTEILGFETGPNFLI